MFDGFACPSRDYGSYRSPKIADSDEWRSHESADCVPLIRTRYRYTASMIKIAILLFAWILPAVIAGALGWSGIWGGSGAFGDYLIPIPVAGGVFHVPSFVVLVLVVASMDRLSRARQKIVPALAFAVFLAAMALQADPTRLANWLFTDFTPSGSPLRFGKNPLYLFVACDAFSLWLYSVLRGAWPSLKWWLAACVPAVAIVLTSLAPIGTGSPRFEIGGARHLDRSRVEYMVYTSSPFDETSYSAWYAERDYFAAPWHSPNYEHSAIYFSSSLDVVERRQFDALTDKMIIATACLYEEDLSMHWHAGLFDCFADRQSTEDLLIAITETIDSDVDAREKYRLAIEQLCRDWKPLADYEPWMDIRKEKLCRRVEE